MIINNADFVMFERLYIIIGHPGQTGFIISDSPHFHNAAIERFILYKYSKTEYHIDND